MTDTNTPTTLYRVLTTAEELCGYKDVVIYWFMGHRAHPAPYADLIADYAELDEQYRMDAESAVAEMFTEDEAHAVLTWLKEHRRGVHVINPIPMPIKGRTDSGAGAIGFGSIPCGGLQDSIAPETDLPFNISGYYDLRDCERVDGATDAARL